MPTTRMTEPEQAEPEQTDNRPREEDGPQDDIDQTVPAVAGDADDAYDPDVDGIEPPAGGE